MPQNEWIKGALLIPENNSYKVDSSGRRSAGIFYEFHR